MNFAIRGWTSKSRSAPAKIVKAKAVIAEIIAQGKKRPAAKLPSWTS
jgi:hypothetical protein